MQTAIDQFRRNIQRVRNLGAIYQALSAQTTQALDLSDLLRSELVMAVSTLDHYIHELVRLGMLEAYQGNRVQTDAFLRFQITLSGALEALNAQGNDGWLEDQIRTSHSYRSFQTPDNITDAVRLVSGVQLWDSVATQMGAPPQNIRAQLRLIVNRRNQIAHEADIDPSLGGRLWPIDFTGADEAVTFTERLAEAIYAVVM